MTLCVNSIIGHDYRDVLSMDLQSMDSNRLSMNIYFI